MPIYEYMCQGCAYKFEVKQSIKDEPVAICSRCGKSVSRIISPPAIMFKGSGWYITDYSDKLKPPSGDATDVSTSSKKETATATAPAAAPTPAVASSSSGGGTASGSSSPSH
ncbi:MAG: transcriptional regulator [Nitrospira sp.]|nr:transcriptional regulator [Nitrospira sp.]MCP9440987.1 transcriptional regulator [Nitrospira sp.]